MKYQTIFAIVILILLGACARSPESAPQVIFESATELTPAPDTSAPLVVTSPTAITLSAGDLVMTLLSPADNTVVDQPAIELYGTTNVETVLTVNGELYVLPGAQEFHIPVSLQEGFNSIELVASDLYANQAELILTIVYDVPEV